MMGELPWFERQMVFGKPKELLPYFLERLHGTIVRLEAKLYRIEPHMAATSIEGKWSILQNVGHLAEVDEVANRRLDEIAAGRHTLSPAVFEPRQNYNAMPVKDVLDYFREKRQKNLKKYQTLSSVDLEKSSRHPRLNVSMTPVDLAWFDAEHDDHHLVKINEIIFNLKKH